MTYFRKEPMSKSKEKVDDVLNYPIRAIPERGINLETASRFGIRASVDGQDGETITGLYSPYTKKGKITGFKKKDLTLSKKERYHFTTVGEVGLDSELFGTSLVGGGKKVFVTEGELDAAFLYQTLKEGVKGTKYESMEPAVISVGCGTANAASHISNNLDHLGNFEEVILAFDQDEATSEERKKGIRKGWDAVAEVAQIVPDVKVATYSEKDPCDMLEKKDELRKAVMFNSKPFKPSGFVTVDDIWEEATKMPEWGKSFPWPTLTKLTYGRRKGEGYYIGAGVKQGKSEWVNQIAQHVIQNEHSKIALFKLEEKPSMTARRVAGKLMGKQFHIPDADFTQEELKEGVDKVRENVLLYDAYYKSDWDSLKAAIRHAVVVERCEDIVIDPITRLTDGLTSSETETELRKFASEISQMSNDLGFTYYCFCHLRAPETGPPHEMGGKVHSNQFRGSRAMMEATHYLIGIERNKSTDLSEEERNTSQFVLLEDRMFGNVGKFPVFYDKMTGSYLEPPEGEF